MNTIFSVERHQPQDVCGVALMIWKLDDKDAVSFFKCALNLRLSRMTLIKCGVNVNLSFLIANEEGKLPSAAVGPSSKGTYFAFVGVQI